MVLLQRISVVLGLITLTICMPVAPAETSESCCERAWRAIKGIMGVTRGGETKDEDFSFAFQDEISSFQEERAGELVAGVSSMRFTLLGSKELFAAKQRQFTISLGRVYEHLYRGIFFDNLEGDARLEEIGHEIIRASATCTYRVFELPKQAQKGMIESAIFRCNEGGQIMFESVEGFEQRVFDAIGSARRSSGVISCSAEEDRSRLCIIMKGHQKKEYDCSGFGGGLGDVVLERNSSNEIVIKPGGGCLFVPRRGRLVARRLSVIREEEEAEEA